MNCGMCIGSKNYNVFSCADDIMLRSLTSTDLQRLINAAKKYISLHSLRYNPNKSTCTTFVANHLASPPTWHICQNLLNESKQVIYSGTVISNGVSLHKNKNKNKFISIIKW